MTLTGLKSPKQPITLSYCQLPSTPLDALRGQRLCCALHGPIQEEPKRRYAVGPQQWQSKLALHLQLPAC